MAHPVLLQKILNSLMYEKRNIFFELNATCQTCDKRANLVYAVKIAVKNDGYIKKGMYGEIKFNR